MAPAETSGGRTVDETERLIAIGDIHGCNVALDTLLGQLRITPSDTVVLLGDIIDRGPGTLEVIDALIQLRERCRLIYIRGNHEEMFLGSFASDDIRERWLEFGGLETLMSYGEHAEATGKLPAEHLAYIKSSVDYYETESAVFVHANLEPGRPLAEQTPEWLRWRRFTGREAPLPTGQRVICGHTAQTSGRPKLGNRWVCLDTYVYGGMFLSALDLTNDLLYQAQETGEFRDPVKLKADVATRTDDDFE